MLLCTQGTPLTHICVRSYFILFFGEAVKRPTCCGIDPNAPGSIPVKAILQCGGILSVAVRIVAVRIVARYEMSRYELVRSHFMVPFEFGTLHYFKRVDYTNKISVLETK